MNSQLTAKNIFIFDKNKCVGCGACAVACMNENNFQSPERWRNIHNSNSVHFPGLPLFYLSLACNHCDDSPCMKNCPALAYSRDKSTGAIIHDAEKCIGCKYCTWACPYDAPKYNPNKGLIEKCTFCNHRIEENREPACANLCPTGALGFNKEKFDSKLLNTESTSIDIGANLKSIPLRNTNGPEIDSSLFEDIPRDIKPQIENKINALKEWPLVIFTLLVSCLVAITAVENDIIASIPKYYFFGVGFVAALLSSLHLGKKIRAWRSVLNQKSSWLSREILSFSLFFMLLLIDTLWIEIKPVLFIFIGFVILFSIDKLYELAMWKWRLKFHSAQTLLISISVILLLTQMPLLFLFIVILRLTLFMVQIVFLNKRWRMWRVIRVLSLLIAAIGLFVSVNMNVLFLVFIFGEIIDRIDFYNSLSTPSAQDVLESF